MLEGSVRQTGVHACGIIIGKDSLDNYIPLCTAKDTELYATQYDGSHVESVGLLKMDFLGLKTLSIIKDAITNIKKSRGIEIDIETIPLDDKKTFDLFSNGETTAIFQFESTGMKRYLRDLKPNRSGGPHRNECPLPSRTNGIYSEVHQEETRNGKARLPAAGNGEISPGYIWDHRLPGTGDAFITGAGRFYQRGG